MDIQVIVKWLFIVALLLTNMPVHGQTHDNKQAYEIYLKSIEKPVSVAQSRLADAKEYFLHHDSQGGSEEVYVVVIIRDELYRWEQVYIRVLLWEEDVIGGQLVTKMNVVSGYPQWAEFVIEEDRVIDWLIIHEDGKEEGNYIINYLSKDNDS